MPRKAVCLVDGKKKCSKCGALLPASAFRQDKNMFSGLQSQCKKCDKSYWDERREKNRISINAEARRYYSLHREEGKSRAKKWRNKNTEYRASYARKYIEKHPEKRAARIIAWNKRRALNPPALCSRCGCPSSKIEAHHADYSRPLDITWLCRQCHSEIHRGMQRGKRVELSA